MDEVGWLTCEDARQMLGEVHDRATDRKLRLFACACARRVWRLLTDARSRAAVEAAERFADGLLTVAELRAHFNEAFRLIRQPVAILASDAANENARDAANTAAHDAIHQHKGSKRQRSARAAPSQFLRDIFGNPFRPVALDPAWLTSDVLALASGIYAERAFDRMPILADALQDAGCTNDDILSHCRDVSAAHVRGCWVCDLVLGKS